MNRRFPRVLIVEDEETICHILARVFEIWKWDYRKAHLAADACTYLCGVEKFDLVLLDLMLPDEPGIEVLKHIKECAPETRVIVITGKPLSECGDVAELHPDMMLQKPFVFEPVRDLADRIMGAFLAARGRMPVGDGGGRRADQGEGR